MRRRKGGWECRLGDKCSLLSINQLSLLSSPGLLIQREFPGVFPLRTFCFESTSSSDLKAIICFQHITS